MVGDCLDGEERRVSVDLFLQLYTHASYLMHFIVLNSLWIPSEHCGVEKDAL